MSWEFTPYFIPLLISAAISTAIAIYSWRQKTSSGSGPLTFLMLAAALWAASYAMELGSSELSLKLFFTGLEYIGIALLPLVWLALALEFSGHDSWLTVNLIHGLVTIASTKGRIKAAFFVPSHYCDYLQWTIKSSTSLMIAEAKRSTACISGTQ